MNPGLQAVCWHLLKGSGAPTAGMRRARPRVAAGGGTALVVTKEECNTLSPSFLLFPHHLLLPEGIVQVVVSSDLVQPESGDITVAAWRVSGR